MDKQRYMISDAAGIVNVESHVLRYWEEELELAVPRNEMGHRYYTKENIDEFMKIKELKEQGYQLKSIKMILHNGGMEDMEAGLQPEQQMGGEVQQMYMQQKQVTGVDNSMYAGKTKLDQFQDMMTQIVKQAIEENNRELGKEVGEQVGDRVLKEMNYLMREQDEQEEERYRKLDEAIRSIHKKKEKKSRLFGRKQQALKPHEA